MLKWQDWEKKIVIMQSFSTNPANGFRARKLICFTKEVARGLPSPDQFFAVNKSEE